jgi:hypothetical protein
MMKILNVGVCKVLTVLIMICTASDIAFADAGLFKDGYSVENALFQSSRTKKPRPSSFSLSGEMRTDFISGGLFLPQYEIISENPDSKNTGGLYDVKGYQAKAQFKVSYLLLNFAYEYASFKSDYSGALVTTPTQQFKGQLDSRIFRCHYTMGFSYVFSKRVHMVFPYTGVTYNKITLESVSPAQSVDQLYEWFNIPAGIRLYFQAINNVVIGIDASYIFVLNPRAQVHTKKLLSGTYPQIQDDANIYLERSWKNFRVETPVDIYIFKYFGITITPWYEYIQFGKPKTHDVPVAYDVNNNPTAYTPVTVSLKQFRSYGVMCSANFYFDFQ